MLLAIDAQVVSLHNVVLLLRFGVSGMEYDGLTSTYECYQY